VHADPLCVWLSGLRWAIDPCFAEANTTRGLDQYEVRQYPGWHPHLLTPASPLRSLAFAETLGEKSPSHDGVPAEDPVGSGVALQTLDDGGPPQTASRHTTASPPRRAIAQKKAKASSACSSNIVGLCGAGLCLLECLRLRVQEVDCSSHQVVVRAGKGN
jgi:hypothetical protein